MTIRSCLYCETRFTTNNNRRLFCSDRCKTRYNRENRLKCFYCGELAGTRDHVTPHSVRDDNQRRWLGVDVVNCCQECNRILGDNHPYDIEKRIMYLSMEFEKKFKLNKPIIQWDEEELEELSMDLARTIRAHTAQWNSRRQRLSHMRLRLLQVCRARETNFEGEIEEKKHE